MGNVIPIDFLEDDDVPAVHHASGISAIDDDDAMAVPAIESASAGDQIEAIFDDHKLSHRKKLKAIITVVLEDMKKRGAFYTAQSAKKDTHQCVYYRRHDTKEIRDLANEEYLRRLLADEYGLLLKSSDMTIVAAHTYMGAEKWATPCKLAYNYHTDTATWTTYVAINPTQVLCLNKGPVRIVDNFVSGTLILHVGDPVEIDPAAVGECGLGMRVEPGCLMHDYFDATYSNEHGLKEHYRQLVASRVLALFFPEFIRIRPLLVSIAEPDSGKTVIAQKAGWMVMGTTDWDVSELPDDKRSMEALLTNKLFVTLDNLDTPKKVRPYTSLLCQTVSGGMAEQRKLFANNIALSYPFISNVFCTSIDLGWVDSTITSRALFVRFDPRLRDGAMSDPPDFKAAAEAIRPALMTEVLGRVRNITIALETQQGKPIPNIIRLGNFAKFVFHAAYHEGWTDFAQQVLENAHSVQRREADDNNPTLDVVRLFIGTHTDTLSQHRLASELNRSFRVLAEAAKIRAEWDWGTFSIGHVLRKQFSRFAKDFGMRRKEHVHLNRMEYWFETAPALARQCVEEATAVLPYEMTAPKDFGPEHDIENNKNMTVEAL